MRLYKVTARAELQNDNGTTTSADIVRWAGTQADAIVAKKEMAEDYNLNWRSRADLSVEEVDVPTNKADLLLWLNTQAWSTEPDEE